MSPVRKKHLQKWLVAIAFALFCVAVWANHDEAGLFQGRTACLVDKDGVPTVTPEQGVAKKTCLIIGMPGYPDQTWVIVEDAKGDAEAVFLMDKEIKVIRKLWSSGLNI